MTQARFTLDTYAVRVLDVVKGQFALKNRNEALKKFIELHGEKHVEMQFEEKFLKELDKTHQEHVEKYGTKTMSMKELDEVLGI